jgi:hypothetical protein
MRCRPEALSLDRPVPMSCAPSGVRVHSPHSNYRYRYPSPAILNLSGGAMHNAGGELRHSRILGSSRTRKMGSLHSVGLGQRRSV